MSKPDEFNVEVRGKRYNVKGDVILSSFNGSACPNCDHKETIVEQAGLENATVRLIKMDGELGKHHYEEGSATWLEAVVSAELDLRAEVPDRTTCPNCGYTE